MKPVLTLLFLVAAGWNNLRAEEAGIIEGKILNRQSGEPLANVSLSVVGTDRRDVSNYAGEFSISGVPVGRQSMRASLPEYVAVRFG